MREIYEVKSLLMALKLKKQKEKDKDKLKELNVGIKLLEWIINEGQVNMVEI